MVCFSHSEKLYRDRATMAGYRHCASELAHTVRECHRTPQNTRTPQSSSSKFIKPINQACATTEVIPSLITYILPYIHNSRCMPLPDRKWPITSFRRRSYVLPVAWLGWVSKRATWWPCLCRTVWSFRSCFWRWLPWELSPVLPVVHTLQVWPQMS